MNFDGKTNVCAKILTREFLHKYEIFRYYFFLKTFVLKTRKNEEKNDIRGATNGAQFIFLSNLIFNVNRLEQFRAVSVFRIMPFIS